VSFRNRENPLDMGLGIIGLSPLRREDIAGGVDTGSEHDHPFGSEGNVECPGACGGRSGTGRRLSAWSYNAQTPLWVPNWPQSSNASRQRFRKSLLLKARTSTGGNSKGFMPHKHASRSAGRRRPSRRGRLPWREPARIHRMAGRHHSCKK
jgi:hypothetical protein